MVDITDKKNTLRFASAEAIIIVSNKQTIRAIQKKMYFRERRIDRLYDTSSGLGK